jgi:hypothetical protein
MYMGKPGGVGQVVEKPSGDISASSAINNQLLE